MANQKRHPPAMTSTSPAGPPTVTPVTVERGQTCPCQPYHRVSELCDNCKARRATLLQRIRTRRNRNQPPITAAYLDPDTVEVVIRAIAQLQQAELAIRRNPQLAAAEPVARLLNAAQGLSHYLREPLDAAEAELAELNRPGGRAKR